MVTAKLEPTHHIAAATMVVLGVTVASVLVATLDPTLAGSTRPHPTLTGSLGDWLSILAENARVLAAPFLLWLLDLATSRLGRSVGDALVLAVIVLNVIPVGLELGRWRGQLVPYLPQLPVEWGALITTVSAWLTIRRDEATRRDIAVLAAVTAALLLAAASVETWATPHRRIRTAASRTDVNTVHRAFSSCGCPWVAFATDFAPARPGRCKVARSLPLTPFGSARPKAGAGRATSTTPGSRKRGAPACSVGEVRAVAG
jgi:hypothetical protein